eukprot:SAG22_NODE_2039_length_3097_cov_4.879586_3_plen_69_part_00
MASAPKQVDAAPEEGDEEEEQEDDEEDEDGPEDAGAFARSVADFSFLSPLTSAFANYRRREGGCSDRS